MKKTLRVGFDLDGVLLYNPARIVRPIISLLKQKHVVINREELEFYVPKPGFQQIFWKLVHKSSICLAPGFKQIKQLKDQGKIEPYLITGRFNHLKKDFEKWKKRMKADELFASSYMNAEDEQPHLFKENLIKTLELDAFIEDNWDIVNHLKSNCKRAKIYWITNLIDQRMPFDNKYLSLKKALEALSKQQLEQ